ncbi:hypothetical protein RHODOSMS8_00982 [Rhodobiaceae bacterium]|nr:hypothetical protein RHODOSMS8_00982 [Rhodobiaceae bacterium]
MNISTLMDLARQNHNVRSDRHLAARESWSQTTVSHWRTGRCVPSPENLITLCNLADIPVEVGLAWRNAWEAHGEAKSICVRIAEDVTRNAGVSLPSEAA